MNRGLDGWTDDWTDGQMSDAGRDDCSDPYQDKAGDAMAQSRIWRQLLGAALCVYLAGGDAAALAILCPVTKGAHLSQWGIPENHAHLYFVYNYGSLGPVLSPGVYVCVYAQQANKGIKKYQNFVDLAGAVTVVSTTHSPIDLTAVV